jgi:hypothetical protein
MSFMSDPLLFVVFAAAIVLAFFAGRIGRKAYLWLRRGKPAEPSGPAPSRQVRRAEQRRRAKEMRD